MWGGIHHVGWTSDDTCSHIRSHWQAPAPYHGVWSSLQRQDCHCNWRLPSSCPCCEGWWPYCMLPCLDPVFATLETLPHPPTHHANAKHFRSGICSICWCYRRRHIWHTHQSLWLPSSLGRFSRSPASAVSKWGTSRPYRSHQAPREAPRSAGTESDNKARGSEL